MMVATAGMARKEVVHEVVARLLFFVESVLVHYRCYFGIVMAKRLCSSTSDGLANNFRANVYVHSTRAGCNGTQIVTLFFCTCTTGSPVGSLADQFSSEAHPISSPLIVPLGSITRYQERVFQVHKMLVLRVVQGAVIHYRTFTFMVGLRRTVYGLRVRLLFAMLVQTKVTVLLMGSVGVGIR